LPFRTDQLGDLCCQLLAQETAGAERVEHRRADLVDVVAPERRMRCAVRIDPLAQLARLGRRDGSHRGEPKRQLLRRMEMKRAP